MKPAPQTIPHDPANGHYGNCFQAVIASLMELPIEDVPHFIDGPRPWNWQKDLNNWLAGYGLVYIETELQKPWNEVFPGVLHLYHEISGQSPRDPENVLHSVVGRDGEIFYDPNPSNEGLMESRENWTYGFIICKLNGV